MDIFDRIMSIRLLRFAQPFYVKYKEQLLYLFFGGLTTVVSIASFALFAEWMHVDALIANVFSWILAVAFAFVTNRTWVFQSDEDESILKQLTTFVGGRLATLGMEELILLVFANLLQFDALLIKVVAQILVVVANYVISKLFVFKAK
ncbi:MAG: GtrA family protein [Oscillospiraceae bacterium]|nr:GtrA family protein [Oscillospiraceae bacterium]